MSTVTELKEKTQPKVAVATSQSALYNFTSIRNAFLATAFYLVLSYFLIGFKTDQLLLAGIFNALYFASRTTRNFILGFSVFIIYWIVFDYMKAFPNYHYNDVHIQSLYEWEKSWFGINWNQTVLTPNEYFYVHTSTFVDILSGLFYLCWIPVPLTFAGILFFKNRNLFFQFSLSFFLVNIIGFIGYYGYPAAPPWYVVENGFNFIASTPGNTAGLERFDAFFGIRIFESIYSKSSNVFAAMPSLHAAYMMIVVFFGIKSKMKGWNLVYAIIMVGIWFAAVYSGHHYILDICAGILVAIIGLALFQWWARSQSGQKTLDRLVQITSR